MRIVRLISFCFILLFCFSGKAPEPMLNMKKIEKKFPYGKLKYYRISDTLKLTAPIDNELFFRLFQRFTTPPPTHRGECGCAIREQIFKGEDYLLGNHGQYKYEYCNYAIDILTVLTKYKDVRRIYWLCYAADEWVYDTSGCFYNSYKKGEITRPYLGPSLAEKYQTDSTSFESYSEFLTNSIFKKTSVLKSKSGACLDSAIQIFSVDYIDMFGMLDEARYSNGKLQHDFEDKEQQELLGY